ncbi:MAG: EF-Tu/IF-2/RF-3 family GTPase [Thermoplasmata archaeon]
MGNLTVAYIGPSKYAEGLGKQSTASDIVFYENKKDDVTMNIVVPVGYPEKLASLFYATSMADMALVVVEKLDAAFGESALMLDCLSVKPGYIVLRGGITKEQLAPLIKNLVLERYSFLEDNPATVREKLMEDATEVESNEALRTTVFSGSVPIDHFFDVKGVGTVALGRVFEGVIKRHDKLKVLPGGKTVEVKSIQKHDADSEWAAKGDLVGLAIKGVEVSDLERGMVLTNNPDVKSTLVIESDASLVKYWPSPFKEDMPVHIGHWMQFVSARVESVSDDGDWRNPRMKIALDKPLVHLPGSKCVLCYLDGGKLRVAGTMELS